MKINFFDLLLFTISLIFFLVIYTEEKSQTYSRVVINFPKIPTIYMDEINLKDVQFNLTDPEKFHLPAFSKNLITLEHDSRISKLNSFCDDYQVKLYNWDKNVGYLTFTMETNQDGDNINSCFLKLKKYYLAQWEKYKEEYIFFLNEATHSLSNFSFFWIKNSKKHFKTHNTINAIRGCEKYYEFTNKLMHVKKIYYDLCGNFVDLILFEKISNKQIPIEKEVYFKLAKDFEKRGLKNYYSNGGIKINIFENENLDTELFFSKENINKDFIRINELVGDSEYMNPFINVKLEDGYYFDFKLSREINMKKMLHIEENLSQNLSNLYISSFDNIMNFSEEYINNIFLNTKKKIFVSEQYKNSKLKIKKSPNYRLSSSKSFYSLDKLLFSLFSAIFIVLLFKLLVNYIKVHNKS